MVVTVSDLINIPVSPTAIRWATFTSLKKFPHTNQGTRSRSPEEILDNLLRGDLAKSALIEHLYHNGVTISQEYDRVRTDNFTSYNALGYHFIANQSKIEVNSSLLPIRDTSATAINRDIKITAGNYGKVYTYPLEQPFDITVQLYFQRNSFGLNVAYTNNDLISIANEVETENDEVLDQLITDLDIQNRYANYLTGYGWANRYDIEQIRINNIARGLDPKWSHPGNSRDYWKCKISDTNPFNTLHLNV